MVDDAGAGGDPGQFVGGEADPAAPGQKVRPAVQCFQPHVFRQVEQLPPANAQLGGPDHAGEVAVHFPALAQSVDQGYP